MDGKTLLQKFMFVFVCDSPHAERRPIRVVRHDCQEVSNDEVLIQIPSVTRTHAQVVVESIRDLVCIHAWARGKTV